ncbi:septal ring lytic transglycosylase RlpA family protein [Candidatus Neomarinimicrobiota bacterium]
MSILSHILLIILTIIMIGCTNAPRYTTPDHRGKISKAVPLSKVGMTQRGISSYYAEKFHGKLTASGEVYDMYGISAAHQTLPLNTIIRVTNLENKKSIILRINDRGPFVKNRILDCSYGAALKLGFVKKGTTKVKIEVIELGDNKYIKQKD